MNSQKNKAKFNLNHYLYSSIIYIGKKEEGSTALESLAIREIKKFPFDHWYCNNNVCLRLSCYLTKCIREICPKLCKDLGKTVITHFFDLWHIRKSKEILKLYA